MTANPARRPYAVGEPLVSELLSASGGNLDRAVQNAGATADIAGPGEILSLRVTLNAGGVLTLTDGEDGTVLERMEGAAAGVGPIEYPLDARPRFLTGIWVVLTGAASRLSIRYRLGPALSLGEELPS